MVTLTDQKYVYRIYGLDLIKELGLKGKEVSTITQSEDGQIITITTREEA